jgi:hypothetical protein
MERFIREFWTEEKAMEQELQNAYRNMNKPQAVQYFTLVQTSA